MGKGSRGHLLAVVVPKTGERLQVRAQEHDVYCVTLKKLLVFFFFKFYL